MGVANSTAAIETRQVRTGWLRRLADAAIGPTDDELTRRRKTLLLLASGLMNAAAFVWVLVYWLMGLKLPTSIPFGFQVLSALVVGIYLRTRNFAFFGYAQLSLFLFFPFVSQWAIGSFVSSSGIGLLALLAPIGAMVCFGPKESVPWFFAFVVLTVVSGFFDYYLASGSDYGIPLSTIAVFFVMNFTILSTIIWLLLRYFVRQRDNFQAELALQHALLEEERRKSERLLNSVLPNHVARRLKENQGTIADAFSDVSVMVADIGGFTRLSERLSPTQVVAFLDEVFCRFDVLVYKYELDKIKTIGDAYMVAGGLIGDRADYADRIADMAIDLMAISRVDPVLREYGLQLHVGIATGPVIAGVIGAKRFGYDLWGDTVNVAFRINGEAPNGTIIVDKTTYRRLGQRYRFDDEREIKVKGKDPMTVYRLVGRL
ncbi:MAG: adenylate/guanylate cyclase domain-containing protein [Betaproteobacteria bacterium]|nr:MAG: adenylate/guanylate cyclase domain-containing protein [Betaproteobacteria bacterium]